MRGSRLKQKSEEVFKIWNKNDILIEEEFKDESSQK